MVPLEPSLAGAPPSAWHRLRGMAREQGMITLALTPLVLLLFGQFSLVGFAANLSVRHIPLADQL
ncbi:MAG TPA: ComEC/Rec2 family competence protein, partial [Caldilinea sp.]|nr:ComEC/Rec2 family competence protein [Caldilinea sp.]